MAATDATLRPPGSGVAVSGERSTRRGPLTSSCTITPDYDDGFSSAAIFLALMVEIRR